MLAPGGGRREDGGRVRGPDRCSAAAARRRRIAPERLEDVQDARDLASVPSDALPAWAGVDPGVAVRPGDGADVAVLLLDTRQGLVTYANPAALALTGNRARLPAPAAAWTAAARLVLRGSREQ